MSPVTHFLLSWTIANAPGETTRRDRALVAIGGIIPAIDGLGVVVDFVTRFTSETPTRLFHTYHHEIGHNIGFAAFCTAAAFALASKGKRWTIAALVLLTFHLHLICDVAGSKGPDGSQWPIPYLLPFSDAWQITWAGQWELNAWPNLALTGALIVAICLFGIARMAVRIIKA